MSGTSSESEQPLQGFLSHLIELRDRLLRMVLLLIVVAGALFPFANTLYGWFAAPLLAALPAGGSMIAVDVISPFLTPIKLALMTAVYISAPYALYQIWLFVAPGLYQSEQRLAMPLLVSSVLLFYLGMAFAYFLVLPAVFHFIVAFAPEGVAVMTDIAKYLDFILAMFLAFGLAFETPVAVVILVLLGVATPQQLREARPYVIVGAFVVGAIMTPPDAMSQIMFAVPLWLLYELGVVVAALLQRQRPVEGADSGSGDDAYHPLTPEQMDAELDRIEAEEKKS
jgi:sec-independent protein translocase protein TatC